MNLADAGVSFINLKQHEQWASNRVVEGYIANSLPIHQECLNCLLPAEETEEVGQVNSKNNNQAIKKFDSYVDLSNNFNLPVAPLADNGELTLYGFSQFNVLETQIEPRQPPKLSNQYIRFYNQYNWSTKLCSENELYDRRDHGTR